MNEQKDENVGHCKDLFWVSSFKNLERLNRFQNVGLEYTYWKHC